MDLLLIMTYAALCIFIFKIFNIPLNKWTVPTALLGGIIIISSLVLLMNYNHPFSPLAKKAFVTTPIVPTVKGRVVEISVIPNQPIKQRDPLFTIEPITYAAEVRRLKAALQSAQTSDVQLDSSVEIAHARLLQAETQMKRALREFKRYEKAFQGGAATQQQVENHEQQYISAKAGFEAVIAEEKSTLQASNSSSEGEDPEVAAIRAQLAVAEFNLEETIVRAPTDGYVTQVALRPGMVAVPLPLRPVMVFVHQEEKFYLAAFRQNSLQRLKAGYEAEFLFKGLPGKVFKGEVVELLPAIGEGQTQATGALLGTEFFDRTGRAIVKIKLTDDLSAYQIPDGSTAEVAVYSDHFSHVAIMRKVLLRMKSWQNFLFLDH
jgi:multidrug resistance efflux pump